MAKNSAVNLDITNNADGFDVAGGTTARKLTLTGADITLTGSGTNTYTYPASTDTLTGRDSTDTLTNKTINTASNTITVTATDVSDFDTEVSNNTDVTANTTHRGLTTNPHSSSISNLTDTSIVSLEDDQLLAYDLNSGEWYNTGIDQWDVVTVPGIQTLTNKTLTTPTIGDLSNSTHTHLDAAGGGTITAGSISDFDTEVANNTDVSANTAKDTNVSTDLSAGTRTATTINVNSSDGTNATLAEADTTNAGILGSDKWDEIVANTLARHASGSDDQVSSDFTHDDLTGVTANEHLDWTTDRGATNIHAGNYTDTNTTAHASFSQLDYASAGHTGFAPALGADDNYCTDAQITALHAESHTVVSHSDTTATGAELDDLTDGSDADGLHAHATNDAKVSYTKTNVKGHVAHGATAATARASGFTSVEWIGSVEPTNSINGDTWIDTT